MEKNSIYGPEITEHYPIEIDFFVAALFTIADRQSQLDYWCNVGYTESALSFDYEVDCLKDFVRSGEINLNGEQVKAILRVHAMCNQFTRIINREALPKDLIEEYTFMVDHPYWVKVQEQARYALSLIKIK